VVDFFVVHRACHASQEGFPAHVVVPTLLKDALDLAHPVIQGAFEYHRPPPVVHVLVLDVVDVGVRPMKAAEAAQADQ